MNLHIKTLDTRNKRSDTLWY